MKLKVIGGLELSGAELTRPKPLLLLSYVTLGGSRARRDLAELFWPESQDPMQSLRVALSHINKEAKGAITSDDKKVWSDLSSDFAQVQSLLNQRNYKEALEAYQGPFLDGFDTSEIGEELEEWIYQTREHLAKEIQEAYLALAEFEASRGHFVYGASLAEKAYFLRSAPEPDSDTLQRLHLLLRAGENPQLESVVKEIKSYGLESNLSVSEAQAQARALQSTLLIADNPYRGLFAFQEEDASFYFGREKAVLELSARIEQPPFIVTVVGNSGAGKSSLVFAGVIPRLRKQQTMLITSLRPGRQPFVSLAQSLLEILGASERDQLLESHQLAQDLQDKTLGLAEVIIRILSKHPQKHFLLAIDQLEELFTMNEMRDLSQTDTHQEARQFLEMLLQAMQSLQGKLLFLFTLRADFLGTLLEYRPLRDMMQHSQYFLSPMDEIELKQSIVEPAHKQGVKFEAGLVEHILEDVSGKSLPLLEFALTQLWEKQEKNLLTHQAYNAIGGVEEALARHADETYESLSTEEKLQAKTIFLQLVYPGINQEDTRRIATRDELEEDWYLVRKLASYPARLLVTGYSQHGETAEVIHEALIRSWKTLRQWLEEYRSFRIWQERLRQDVRLWTEQDYKDSTLLRGYRLSEAVQKIEVHEALLSANDKLFIRRSLDLSMQEISEKEMQRQEQINALQKLAIEESSRRKAEESRVRTRNNALRLVSLLGMLALSFAIFFFSARNQALQARNEALVAKNESETQRSLVSSRLSELLGAVALNTLNTTPQRSLLLALEAHKVAVSNASETQEAESVLREVFGKTGGVNLIGEPVSATGFSPDGKWMVTGDDNANVTFWEVANPSQPVLTLPTQQSSLRATEFSPDGKWLAVGGGNDTVRLWDMSTFPENTPTSTITLEHDGDVTDIAFSPTGNWMASVSRDGYLRLWDTQTWQLYKQSQPLQDPSLSVAFSPDGQWLAATTVGEEEGHTFIYPINDLNSFTPIIYTLKDAAWSLAFSSDSQYLAIGDEDGQIHVLSMQALENPSPIILKSHALTITDLAFSPDGKWLADSSWDQTIRLWPVQAIFEKPTDDIPILLRGHETRLSSALAFSNDSQWLLSGATDSARLWDLRLLQPNLMMLPPEQFGKRSFSLSPDGKQMLNGYIDGTVTLQPLDNLIGPSTVLGKHDSWVESVTFSPDGKWAASSGDASNGGEHTLMIWNLEKASVPIIPELAKNAKTLFDVEFSSDNRLLASAGEDKTVQVWDLSNVSQPKYIFKGHRDMVTDVAFSPDGNYLASASFDHTVRLWNLQEPDKAARILGGHTEAVRVLTFSPDGKWLASGDWNSQVLLWSFEHLDEAPLRLNTESLVWSVAFSLDNQYLAAGTEEGSILVWTVGSENSIKLTGHQKAVWSLDFTSDHKWLISASEDTTQRFWLLDIETIKTLACQKAGRNLSQQEWADVFRSTPYQKTCEAFAEGQ